MVKITLTLSFAFPNGSAKPSMGEIATFVKTLDANPLDMDATYRIAEEKSIFIKFKSEASMHYALMHNQERLAFQYANGKTVEVQMSLAGGNVQYVRVYDLPPEVPDKDLSLVLGRYGKVKRVIREKFPVELGLDMHTGVRGVYMDVEKEIPTSLNFLNRKGNVFYPGNKDRCFHCKAEGHRMDSCPKRKSRKQQQQNEDQPDADKKRNEKQQDNENLTLDTKPNDGCSSYSGVVTGGTSPDNSMQEQEEIVEILHEEVVDMDVVVPEKKKTEPELNWCQQRQKHWNDLYDYEAAQKKKKLEKKNDVVKNKNNSPSAPFSSKRH